MLGGMHPLMIPPRIASRPISSRDEYEMWRARMVGQGITLIHGVPYAVDRVTVGYHSDGSIHGEARFTELRLIHPLVHSNALSDPSSNATSDAGR